MYNSACFLEMTVLAVFIFQCVCGGVSQTVLMFLANTVDVSYYDDYTH